MSWIGTRVCEQRNVLQTEVRENTKSTGLRADRFQRTEFIQALDRGPQKFLGAGF